MNVFSHDKYRAILQEYLQEQPKKGHGLVKVISEHLRVKSSQLSQVISGKRDFSDEQAFALTKFMGLRPLETKYFLTLVAAEKAGTHELRSFHKNEASQLKEASTDLKQRLSHTTVLNDTDKSIFYSSYLYSAVRIATSLGDGKSIGEIADLLKVPHPQVAEILAFLVEKGLCAEKRGLYTVGLQHTHVGRGSPFLVRHHHNWRVKALERSLFLTDKELQFTAPASIDEEGFEEIRALLVQVIEKSAERIKASKPTGLACLLIDWFRI